MKRRLNAKVFGVVQGVGYRYFVRRKAIAMSITGFAENLFDGSVKVVAEGEEKDLEQLLNYLKEGNESAIVTDVRFEYSEYKGEFVTFSIY